jgi:hypothetical protein
MDAARDAWPQSGAALIEVDGSPVGTAGRVIVHGPLREVFLERLNALANMFFTESVSPLGPSASGTPLGDVVISDRQNGAEVRLVDALVLYVSSGSSQVRLRGAALHERAAVQSGDAAAP